MLKNDHAFRWSCRNGQRTSRMVVELGGVNIHATDEAFRLSCKNRHKVKSRKKQ